VRHRHGPNRCAASLARDGHKRQAEPGALERFGKAERSGSGIGGIAVQNQQSTDFAAVQLRTMNWTSFAPTRAKRNDLPTFRELLVYARPHPKVMTARSNCNIFPGAMVTRAASLFRSRTMQVIGSLYPSASRLLLMG
jgi:hypothetical protein